MESIYCVGDVVQNMHKKGKIIKIKKIGGLPTLLIKYSLFNKHWSRGLFVTPCCESCKNHKTTGCPNSDMCFDTEAKLYYISKNKVAVNEEVNQ